MKQCHNGTEQLIVIDSNPKQNEYICKLIQRAGFPIKGLYSLKSARCFLANGNYVIITNSHLSDGECVDLLEWIHSNGKTYPVIIVTNRPEVHTAVTVMKLGATDYIPIQLAEDKLPLLIQDLQQEDKKRTLHSILQRTSEAFQKIHHRIRLVAPTELSVLILGESGTGKENVARELHRFSKRADKPFVAVDCGSLSAALSYSAFFGHEKGAFTGADTAKTGFLQEANGGTLFLDEVGNLPVETQQMLLRALQEKRYRPVGAKEDRIFNVRIIAATNENLNIAVIEKRFRQDLLYRLQDFTIIVPPLRDCQDDIMPLADFFREQANKELGCYTQGFDKSARNAILYYKWSGNVRELRQKVRSAVLLAQEKVITRNNLELEYTRTHFFHLSLKADKEEERKRIIQAIKYARGNYTIAAYLLEISKTTLYYKMKQHHIRIKHQ